MKNLSPILLAKLDFLRCRTKNIAIVVGVFPSISETFINNQIVFLKSLGYAVTILYTRERINENRNYNSLPPSKNKHKNIYFTWKGLKERNNRYLLIPLIKIILKSIRSTVIIDLLKSFNIFRFGVDAINGNQFFKLYYKYFFKIENFDVVHVHFADNAVHLYEQLSFFRKPIVITFHGYDAHKYDASFYSILKLLKSSTYTVNTKFTRGKVLSLGFDFRSIMVLPMGLDTNYFNPMDSMHKGFNILFVGRMIELKAPLFALKIVEEVIKKSNVPIEFHMVGEGSELERCKAYISERNLTPFIKLHGSLAQKDIVNLMNESDVFLFPGIIDSKGQAEAQGLVLQEAQSMRLPVIISDVGGMKEGIIDGETGYVVPEKNIEEFVKKILFLIEHDEVRKKMGDQGREFVKQNYDSKVLGEQLINIYNNA